MTKWTTLCQRLTGMLIWTRTKAMCTIWDWCSWKKTLMRTINRPEYKWWQLRMIISTWRIGSSRARPSRLLNANLPSKIWTKSVPTSPLTVRKEGNSKTSLLTLLLRVFNIMTSSSTIATLSNKTKPTISTLSWLSLTHQLKKKYSILCSTLISGILTSWRKSNSRGTESTLTKSNITLLLTTTRMLNKLKYALLKSQGKFLWSAIKKIQDSMNYKANKCMNTMVLSLLWMFNLGNSFISWSKVCKVLITHFISSL